MYVHKTLWLLAATRALGHKGERANDLVCDVNVFRKIFGLRQDSDSIGVGHNRSGRNVLPAAPMAVELKGNTLAHVQRFLNSHAGAIFLERMRAIEAATAATSVQDMMHTSHSAGRAAGFADARRWILSLSRLSVRDNTEVRAGQATFSEGTKSEDDSQAHTGEAPLVERLSP